MSVIEFSTAAGVRRTVLVHRFEMMLKRLDHARRVPTGCESYHLHDFVEFVGLERWRDAADALQRAEQAAPVPAQAEHLVEASQMMTTAEFRQLLLRTIDRD